MLVKSVLLMFLFYKVCYNFTVVNPVWQTSIYFRAGQQNVINTLTGNDQTPSYTFTFSSSLTGVPNIAYGIGKYQGIDYLMEQYFQIFRIGLTSSSFSVAVQISGSTSLYILRVPYLAIQPTFPHHLNTFDNIAVNYDAGSLVNITTRSMSQTTYLNTINYTRQCAGRKYSKFNSSLTNYKMIFFLTSLFVSTVKQTLPTQNYSLYLRTEYNVLSEQFYSIKVLVQVNVIITRLKYSQIIFDQIDVQNSQKYQLMYELWQVDNMGGAKQIPIEFQDNFIMAISQFKTPHGYCGFDYMWDWKQNSTFFGVFIYESITRKGVCAFDWIVSSVLYIKSWKCLTPYYYYNASSRLCQDQCGLYTYGTRQLVDIELNYQCSPCEWGCSKCNSSHFCTECNNDDMRVFNGHCYCPKGYLDTYIVTKCEECADPHCLICQKNLNYDSGAPALSLNSFTNLCVMCDLNYFLNVTTRSCDQLVKCNPSANELINYETNRCEVCSVQGCLECRQTLQLKFNGTITDVIQIGKRNLQSNQQSIASSSFGIVTCAICSEANQYFMNLFTKVCQRCNIFQCQICSSLYTCYKCNNLNQYFLNMDTLKCDYCTVQGCLNCVNSTFCNLCNNQNGYFLDSNSGKCKKCGLGCTKCNAASQTNACLSCAAGLKMKKKSCRCEKGNFLILISSAVYCQPCISTCKSCQLTNSTCRSCYFQQNRILNLVTNSCECNSSNYIDVNSANKVCQKVNLTLCDMGYSLDSLGSKCLEICGDGVRVQLDCDDGNLQNLDGCNSKCKIEQNFTCTDQKYESSICQYFGSIWIDPYNITKDPYNNILEMNLKLNPDLVLYQALDWQLGLFFSSKIKIEIINANMINDKVLYLKVKYYGNVKNQNIQLGFKLNQTQLQDQLLPLVASSMASKASVSGVSDFPSAATRLLQSNIQITNFTFRFIDLTVDFSHTTNNLDAAYYPEDVYKTVSMLQTIFQYIIIAYLVFMFTSLLFFKRIVPVTITFIAIQFCFISLSSIQNIQPQTFSIITNFNQILGLNNLHFFPTFCENQKIISSLTNLKFQYCFLSNLNLMLAFQGLSIICAFIISIFELFRSEKSESSSYSSYFKRILSNFIFFNLVNTTVSFGILYSVGFKSISNLFGEIIQLILTLFQLFFIFKFKKTYFIQIEIDDFGEKDLFQRSELHQNQSHQIIRMDQNSHQQSNSNEQNYQQSSSKSSSKTSSKTSSKGENSQIASLNYQILKKSKSKDINSQIFLFLLFTLGIGFLSPLCFSLFIEKSTLMCNLIGVGIVGILIVVQITLQPFQKEQLFSEAGINYYFIYGFILIFLSLNMLFSFIDNNFSNNMESKTYFMSYLSYGQIFLFLLMLIYLIIQWSYSFYLSFFQQEIWNKHCRVMLRRTLQQSQQKVVQNIQHTQYSKQNKRYYDMSSQCEAEKGHHTTAFTNQAHLTPMMKRDDFQEPEFHHTNLIYEVQESSDGDDRF